MCAAGEPNSTPERIKAVSGAEIWREQEHADMEPIELPANNASKTRNAVVRVIALLFAIPIGSTALVRAGDDVATGQSVIRSQEAAIGRDDAAAAYAFASPSIKSWFRTPDTFMFMVRNSYTPVYRHRSFEFGEGRIVEGKIYQEVHIIDADGEAWEALYTLESQSDGSVKISGCVLKKAVIS
jgi:Domain of unknown function (DUF4864)